MQRGLIRHVSKAVMGTQAARGSPGRGAIGSGKANGTTSEPEVTTHRGRHACRRDRQSDQPGGNTKDERCRLVDRCGPDISVIDGTPAPLS